MAPDRHSMSELHRSTDDATGTNITAGYAPLADGSGNVDWGPVGSGSDAELNIEGGQDVINARGSMGSTETIDPTLGNVVTGTLNADCTLTISAPVGSGASTLEFWITQDGTGGWDITWPGSVTWDGGTPTPDTTAGVTVRYILESIDGGTNWIGNMVGGSSGSASPLTTKGDLWGYSTVDDRVPVGTNGQVLTADSTAALGVSYQTPSASSTSAWQHAHINTVIFSGDGSTTAFTLPAAPVDAYSAAAYVNGVRVDVALSGTLLDTMTFGTAPGSGTDNILVDIVAVVV